MQNPAVRPPWLGAQRENFSILWGTERRFPLNLGPHLRHMATVKLREMATFDFVTFTARPQFLDLMRERHPT